KSSKIKYLNHSCNPNCYLSSRDKNSLYLVALKDIDEFSELTIDYGYDEIYVNCKCSSCKNITTT
ncbi:MAG TPA: SET domain-containing protein, partial [Melioribacteraceae bacterium]|nr:SET domain-containing protein [Melioribacteraceae bacterium]